MLAALDDSELDRYFAEVERQPFTDKTVTDEAQLRRQIVQGMIVLSLLDEEAERDELTLIEAYAIALDVEPAMVEHMQQRFQEAGIENAEARVVQPDDPGLEPGSVDRILIVDTWHHIQDRPGYAGRLRSALRPGGFVLVVDFTEDSPHGPPEAMRLNAHEVHGELSRGGLTCDHVDEELPYQFIVRATRPTE